MSWHCKFSGYIWNLHNAQILIVHRSFRFVHLTYSKFVLQIFIVCRFDDKFRISDWICGCIWIPIYIWTLQLHCECICEVFKFGTVCCVIRTQVVVPESNIDWGWVPASDNRMKRPIQNIDTTVFNPWSNIKSLKLKEGHGSFAEGFVDFKDNMSYEVRASWKYLCFLQVWSKIII